MTEELEVALRRAIWQACGEAGAGLGLIVVARQLGVRLPAAWGAVAWLLEAGHLVVREGRLVAIGWAPAGGAGSGGA